MEKRLREKRKVCDARMLVCAEIFQKFFENFFEKKFIFLPFERLGAFFNFSRSRGSRAGHATEL